MTRQGGAAVAIRGVSRRTVGILAALGSAAAWGLGATTSDYVLSSGMGNDTFLVLELGIGFLVLIGIGAVRGELGGFRHPGLARAATTGLIEPWGAYTLGNIGIIFSSGAFVALVSSLNPVLISLLALPFLGERVSRTAAVLMIVSIGGVVLVVLGLNLAGILHIPLLERTWRPLDAGAAGSLLRAGQSGHGLACRQPLQSYGKNQDKNRRNHEFRNRQAKAGSKHQHSIEQTARTQGSPNA